METIETKIRAWIDSVFQHNVDHIDLLLNQEKDKEVTDYLLDVRALVSKMKEGILSQLNKYTNDHKDPSLEYLVSSDQEPVYRHCEQQEVDSTVAKGGDR